MEDAKKPGFWTVTVASTFLVHLFLILASLAGGTKHNHYTLAIQLGATTPQCLLKVYILYL